MRRQPLRHLLVFAQVAFHAAVMLGGPCLHGMPGADHRVAGTAAKSHAPDGGGLPSHDASNHCLVCQFFSQGQLPVAIVREPGVQQVVRLEVVPLPRLECHACRGAARPRAPPAPACA